MKESISGESFRGSSDPLPVSIPGKYAPDLQSGFSEDISRLLLAKSEQFARHEVNRQKWRAASGGVLPEGYDASSIAAEAAVSHLYAASKSSLFDPGIARQPPKPRAATGQPFASPQGKLAFHQ
jgi:hypothetical protein